MGVDARSDGGGLVRAAVGLDREALQAVPDLARQLQVDDLRRAGWEVQGPRDEGRGVTWVRAQKEFSSPGQAQEVASELNGTAGPFRRFRLTRHRSLLRTTTRLDGTVDLTRGLEGFEEEELRRRLSGGDLGLRTDALQRRLDVQLDRIFRVEVDAGLPGEMESNAPVERGGRARWRPQLGQQLQLQATARAWNTRTIVFGTVALVAAAGAVLAWRRRPGIGHSVGS